MGPDEEDRPEPDDLAPPPPRPPQPAGCGRRVVPKKMGWRIKKLAVEHVQAYGWNTGAVAHLCGVTTQTLNKHLRADVLFRERIDEAKLRFNHLLEKEAIRRAVEGVEDFRTDGAGGIIPIRKYSDFLLAKLLKANDPERYGDRVRVEKTVEVRATLGLSELPAAARAKLLEALEVAFPDAPEDVLRLSAPPAEAQDADFEVTDEDEPEAETT